MHPNTTLRTLRQFSAQRFAFAAVMLACGAGMLEAQPDTLRKLADARGIRVGAAVTFPSGNNAANRPEYERVLRTSFNTVVCENAMKFQNLFQGSTRGVYNWGPADAVANFADSNGMQIRGHTFVWHSQTATWFNNLTGTAASRDTTLKIMREHIDSLGTRYKGRVKEWDVVNEAIAQSGGTSPNYRTDSRWYSRTGSIDYIDSAFAIAQRTDTNALLTYNDFGAEGMNNKSQNVYDLVSGLKQRGAPIHVVGLQAHFSLTDHDTAAIGQNMRRLAALGFLISFTEIDIQTSNTTTNLESQKARYKALMALCLSVPACKSYMAWGLNDAQSWRGANAVALLFTGTTTITPKPAYWGVVEALAAGSTATSIPSAPWNVVATPIGTAKTSVNVMWRAPGTDGRSTITSYKAMAWSDTTKSCTTTGAMTCNISGLNPDSSYRFVVRAGNAIGMSGISPPSRGAGAGPVSIARSAGNIVGQVAEGRFTSGHAFELSETAARHTTEMTMFISDVSGRIVWAQTVRPSAGMTRTIAWNGATQVGAEAPAGMYIARVRATTREGVVQEAVQKGIRFQ